MARQVMDLLERINEMGTTIIMVTHDPELARRAHRNVQVVDGQISDFKPYESHTGGPGAPHAHLHAVESTAQGA
jgi:putative ABC transport system ATP-binding protein